MENKETKEVLMYACGYCGTAYRDKVNADFCHSARTCAECGIVIGKVNYHTKCDFCITNSKLAAEKVLFDNARKITVKEFGEEFGDNPLLLGDNYCFDIDSILDEIYGMDEEDRPNYVWGTKGTEITLDADYIISNFEENCELEDYSMDSDAQKEIFEFCKQWNEKHAQTVYYQNDKIAVIINQTS